MSKITTIYNALLPVVAAIFPSKTKIANPYDLESNPEGFLREGYGVKINSMEPEEGEFCKYRYNVEFSVIITKEVIKTDENATVLEVATLALLEDINTARFNLDKNHELGVGNSVDHIDVGSSTGIEFISGDKFNFISMELNFSISTTEERG